MRRIGPWLPPIAVVHGVLALTMFRALTVWGLFVCLFSYAVPYAIPLLLLALMRRVRRHSAAPPVAGWVALVSALPALVIALWWPLGVAYRIALSWPLNVANGFALNPHMLLNRAVTIDDWVSVSVWFASVVTTAAWLFVAACRWYWFPRPVVVVGTPPYR
jgi:hypothetical protein